MSDTPLSPALSLSSRLTAATACFDELMALARAPLNEEIAAETAMQRWNALLTDIDLTQAGDLKATGAILEQLRVMNAELCQAFTERRDALAKAFKQQQRTHTGIDVYRGLK